jgi:transposase-like protein
MVSICPHCKSRNIEVDRSTAGAIPNWKCLVCGFDKFRPVEIEE